MNLFAKKILFLWKENDLYGFIDNQREQVIPCIYKQVSKMINDFVWLFNGKKWIFSDASHNISISKVDNLIDYDGNISVVEINKEFFLINHWNENKFFKLKKNIMPHSICENGFILASKNEKYGFINDKCVTVINFLYDQANQFFGKYASVKIKDKWGLIDENNKFIINPKYEYISKNCNEFIKVKLDNKEYFIDKNEHKYLYDFFKEYKFHDFNELLVGFEYKNKKGYMNQFFEIEIMKKFDEISNFNLGFAVIKYKNYFGVIDKRFKWVLKPIYKKIIDFDGFSFYVIKKNDQYDHLSVNGNSFLAK